jgi:type II secretory pathway pseudopilin PulG
VVARARGFTYLGVLFATALLTAGLGLAIESWHTILRRDKEADLLHIGAQYQRAIMLYYEGSPDRRPRYPRELGNLVKDERYPSTRRYLRKLYPDPITGSAEWGIMKAPDGGIMGVYSTSTATPLKVLGAGAGTYADWKFAYVPATAVAPVKPTPKPQPAARTAR